MLGGIATFFAFVLVAVASPFDTQTAPVDGAGLTPSLQNPYMVAHPPMLYLGYVGLSIPFAFAAGALLSGRTDERWIVATRRWTLAAWTFLGFGQLLGAHWAYVEVGWGGYYAWDPVENAALMPWLAATAFLHSVMVQERKGMLKVWNMVLVALAFELSVFGTFLTRSGVVNSIHSFAKSSIGGWFLAFVVISSLFSVGLILYRLPLLRARTKLESALSREATFLYNNLLLVALCLTILWGVLFPILTQLVKGESRTIGRPYYDFFLRVLRAAAPATDGDRAADRLASNELPGAGTRLSRGPLAVAVVAGVVLVAAGAGSSTPGLIAYTFSAFVLGTIARRARPRHPRDRLAVRCWSSTNRRRYGGYIVHAAIVLLAIGDRRARVRTAARPSASSSSGQSMARAAATRSPTAAISHPFNTSNATETRAVLRRQRSLAAARCSPATTSTATRPSRRARSVSRRTGSRGEDLYVIANDFNTKHERRLRQGARQAARQPDLDRRASSSCSARRSRSGRTRASSAGS